MGNPMVEQNSALAELLAASENHLKESSNRIARDAPNNEGPAVAEPAENVEDEAVECGDAVSQLAALEAKLAKIESSTDDLNTDNLGLLEDLERERLDFKASRQRAQESVDQFRELESAATQDAISQLSALSLGDAEGEGASLEELQMQQMQLERQLGRLMHLRSAAAQQIAQLQRSNED